jgi:AraC-like DNA-binding protein
LNDPLAQVIGLLRPSASFSKLVTAFGRWAVRPPGTGPFYGAVLHGDCELSITGHVPVRLGRGDFILIPVAADFTVSSLTPPPSGRVTEAVEVCPGVFHLGEPGVPDVRLLVGYCAFGSNDAALLVALLPELVIVRGEQRLTTLVELLSDEARADRPGRNVVLARLLEVLLIEAFRATAEPTAAPGLLRGLADERLAAALRRMHGEPTRPWTVGELAREAALSRSTFFDRFRREVGVPPMEYLLGWRMAVAKDLLCGDSVSVGEVAQRVGYSSSSTFSVAFTRQVGASPTAYARGHGRFHRGVA